MGTKRGYIMVLLQGLVLLLLVAVAPPPLAAITFTDAGAGFFSEPVATLAPFKPVGLRFAPDGRIFIWQRDGVIRIVKNGVLLPTPFLDFSSKVNTYTDRGFLGVALDPNFAANGFVYVFYTYEAGGNPNDPAPKTSHLSRVTADPNNPDVMLANSEVILLGTADVPPCSNYPVGTDCFPTDDQTHSVGSLRFLPDGTLFASHGDGASASFADVRALRSQSLDSYAGKILRIKPDGTAPQAPLTVNPFNDGTNSIRSKVWAYGLRNPFRFGVHPTTNLPFIGDVGWDTWEEINRGAAGANYGWPCWEGNAQQPLYQAGFPTDCQPVTSSVVTFPLYAYDRSVGTTAIGGAFFTGAQYPAAYTGNFFFADYTKGWMKRIVFDGSGNVQSVVDFATAIGNVNGGPVALELGPDGLLYYVVFTTGEIARIRNTSGTGSNFPPFAAASTTTPANGYSPLAVSFSSAGSLDPEGGALTYLWEFGDGATDPAPNPSHTYTAASVTTFPVRLTVTDPLGAKSTASLTVVVGSTPPVAAIDLPATGAQFTVGQTATYHGSATDLLDNETIPSTALHWTVLLHHNTHIHPFIETTGSGGSFPVDNHDPTSTWGFEFILTATDSSGLTNTKSITVPVNPPPPGAPVLLYGMNEGSGTTVTDLSGNGHTGSLVNGPAWVAGQATYGQALSFNGVNNAVSVINPSALNFGTSDFTYEVWVKRNVLGGQQRHLLSKCTNATWVAGCKEFYFKATNQLTLGSFATGDTGSVTIADTNWHHVAVTFVDATNTLNFYVDGTLRTTATKALEADGAGHLVTIGNHLLGDPQGANAFSGLLDEVRIYSRALTQTEIQADMNTPITPPGPDTTPPTAPGTPTATVVNATQINLTWAAATDNVGVTGYRVERCAGAGCVINFLEVGQPIGTSFGDTGLTPLTTYRYQVRAIDAASNLGPYSTIASATTPALDTTPPTVPTGLGATASGSSQITLNWTAATDNIGVTGYGLERCQGATCTIFAQIATPSGTTYNDTGLLPSTTYQYQVRATDAAGNFSGYSNIASATTAAATGLVDAYAFTEGSGTTTADLSGNGHTGSLMNGPAWVPGQATYGQALSFDGVDDAVSVANPSTLNFGTSDFTFEVWVKRNVLGGQQRHLLSKCTNATWVAGCKELYFKATNQLTLGSFATGDTGSVTIADTNWHHVAVTFVDATNTLSFYVDGTLRTTATKALEADGVGHVVTVGNHLLGGLNQANDFSGLLDEVRIYSRVLTLAEIQTDMTTPITPPGPDTTPPTAPGTPTATVVNATQINLTWAAATDNVGVTGYRVERCAGAGCVINFLEVGQPIGTSFGDTGLTPLTTYRYQVRAIDAASNLGPYSTIASATTPALDTTPPTVPTGLGATASGSSQITLNWTAATDNIGVTGYGLERCQGATCTIFAQIATPSGTTYNDTGLLPSTTYQYQVRATDAAGNFSGYSNIASATTAAATGLVDAYAFTEGSGTTTADLSGNGHTGSLMNGPAWVPGQATYGQALSFDGVDDAVSVANPSTLNFGTSDFTFEVWVKRNVLGGQQRHLLSKCTNATWVAGCKELYFKATNQLTLGSFATGDTGSVTIADTNWHHVAVTFVDATNTLSFYVDGTLRTTATKALEADGVGHVVTVGNHLLGGLNQANDFSGLLDEVRIYSRALTQTEIQADMNTPITPPDTTPPSDVTGLTATTVSATQINLSWTAATDPGGGTVTYRVERCQGAGCSTFAQIATSAGTTFGDTSLIASTPYSYRVKAVDAANNVSVNYSNEANATTQAAPPDTTPPSDVTGLTATAAGSSQINLAWTVATDSGGSGLAGYRVERCQGAGCTTFAQIATPSTNSYSDTGLTAGTSYSYRVKAVDGATNVSVNYSNTASATPPTTLVMAYGMNEGSGTTLADASGNGHTGSLLNGPAWVAGQATYGQALSFDGVDDAVSVANPSTLNFGTSDFTFEVWVKRNVLGGQQRHLLSKCTNATWVAGCKELYFKATNQLTLGSFATGDTGSVTIADTNWHHVAVTFVDTTNTLSFYVDGTLRTTATKALEADGVGHVVTVGNHLLGGLNQANDFSGLLDEVRIYSRALTQTEIQADMNTPITP